MAGSRVHPWLRKCFRTSGSQNKGPAPFGVEPSTQTSQCFGCVGRQRFRCIFNSFSIAESQVPVHYISFQIMTTRKVPSFKDWISQPRKSTPSPSRHISSNLSACCSCRWSPRILEMRCTFQLTRVWRKYRNGIHNRSSAICRPSNLEAETE
jgi:hypothetical protein